MTYGEVPVPIIYYYDYESDECQQFLRKILPQLETSVAQPLLTKKPLLDECIYSCAEIDTPHGLYINLRTYCAVGPSVLLLDAALTECFLYLNILKLWTVVPQTINSQTFEEKRGIENLIVSADDSPLKAIYKFALCYVTPNDEALIYRFPETTTLRNDANQSLDSFNQIPLPDKVFRSMQYIVNHCNRLDSRGAVLWQDEVVENDRVQALKQIPNPPILDRNNLKCQECQRATNLWLHLADGFVGCGRKNYGMPDTGCLDGREGAAVRHYENNMDTCTLAVKLGTLTPTSADVYSYPDDAMVHDSLIVEHLRHFGIHMSQGSKTEKSLTELELEYNKSYQWKTTKENLALTLRLKNSGYVGLQNYGNTCYMNVILQLLARVPELRETLDLHRFIKEIWDLRHTLKDNYSPEEDVLLQFSRLLYGLTSTDLQIHRESMLKLLNPKEKLAYQDEYPFPVLHPYLFRQISVRGHMEFSSSGQQDAEEYLRYLLDFISRISKKHALPVAQNAADTIGQCFNFTIEEQLRLVEHPNSVKVTTSNEIILSLPLQSHTESIAMVESHETSSDPIITERSLTFEECLLDWMAGERVTLRKLCNGKTRTVEAQKSRKIKTFPQYFIVQLGRFHLDANWTTTKIQVPVKMPLTLDLSNYQAKPLSPYDEVWESDGDSCLLSDVTKFNAQQLIVIEDIQGMGFTENAAKNALVALNRNATVEQYVDWILAHMDSPEINCFPSSITTKSFPVTYQSELLSSMGFSPLQIQISMMTYNGDEQQSLEWLMTTGSKLTEENLLQLAATNNAHGSTTIKNATFYGSQDPLPSSVGKYKLIGFCHHKGPTANSGHYTFCTRHSQDTSQDMFWVCLNDQTISECSSTFLDTGYLYLYGRCAT